MDHVEFTGNNSVEKDNFIQHLGILKKHFQTEALLKKYQDAVNNDASSARWPHSFQKKNNNNNNKTVINSYNKGIPVRSNSRIRSYLVLKAYVKLCQSVNVLFCYFSQAVQLLVCDWLLSTRTAIWQQEQSGRDEVSSSSVSQPELVAFQQDLASLRKIAQHVKAALPRVSV